MRRPWKRDGTSSPSSRAKASQPQDCERGNPARTCARRPRVFEIVQFVRPLVLFFGSEKVLASLFNPKITLLGRVPLRSTGVRSKINPRNRFLLRVGAPGTDFRSKIIPNTPPGAPPNPPGELRRPPGDPSGDRCGPGTAPQAGIELSLQREHDPGEPS